MIYTQAMPANEVQPEIQQSIILDYLCNTG